MATPEKKHLIELMIEAGVKWPEGAKYAAQDKRDNRVYFFTEKPFVMNGNAYYCDNNVTVGNYIQLPSICRNWHQTIVTSEQYEQALTNTAVITKVQTKPKHCESVMNQEPYTINQLTSDYYAKAAEAEYLQCEADEARKLANEALITLQKAGELIGLIISVDTLQKCTEQHQQPVITDWRDLRVGDAIWVGSPSYESDAPCGEYCITELDSEDTNQPVRVDWNGRGSWPELEIRGWHFIRRP